MSRRRRGLNPAKVKAELAAIDTEAPRQAPQPRLDIRGRGGVALLCLLSAALLLISFAPFDHWYLAYVALVPLGLSAAGGRRRRWAMLWAYLGGVGFWAAGLYWLTWVAPVGYVPLVLYLGLYWLAVGGAVRLAFRRRWPIVLVLPVVWVALEYARAFVLTGFPWFFLAHSQWGNARLIQVCDVTGQYGVSFFVAMVNGAVIDALARPLFAEAARPGRPRRRIILGVGACLTAGATLLIYGTARLAQQTTRPGPTVGVVQLAFPISLGGQDPPEEIFARHLDNTRPLVGAGCDLVVWPESMLGHYDMDPAVWFARDADEKDPVTGVPLYTPGQQAVIRKYQADLAALQRLLADLGCPLLAGGSMSHPGSGLTTNSALLLDRDERGRIRLAGQYDKMHPVPFSEQVPFRRGWPALHKLLRRLVPEVMTQLTPGRIPVRFEVPAASKGQVFRFAVPICYEGTIARVCRRLVMQDGRKQVDMLVNISNDGWFIFSAGGRTHASAELEQHLAQYVFRAVESRTPVVRAVNTGISAHIDSNGRLCQVVEHGGRRKMVGGNLVARTLVDERISIYSRTGDLFAWIVSAVGVLAGLFVLAQGRTRSKDGAYGKT